MPKEREEEHQPVMGKLEFWGIGLVLLNTSLQTDSRFGN